MPSFDARHREQQTASAPFSASGDRGAVAFNALRVMRGSRDKVSDRDLHIDLSNRPPTLAGHHNA